MSDILIGTAAIAYAEVNTYGCVGVGVFTFIYRAGFKGGSRVSVNLF